MQTFILSTFLYASENWTLTVELERMTQALEIRCYRRLLNISYKGHVTNVEVRSRIQNANGVHDYLLPIVKKLKLIWCGHISRPLAWQRQVYRGKWKEQEGEGNRRRDGKMTSKNGQKWSLGIPWGTGSQGNVKMCCCSITCGARRLSRLRMRWDGQKQY